MSKCRHLKDGHGFYTKRVEAYRQYYTADGDIDGSDSGEHSGGGRGGRIAYCDHCDRRLSINIIGMAATGRLIFEEAGETS